MKPALKIVRYELSNLIRSRFLVAMAVVLFVVAEVLFRFGGDTGKTITNLFFEASTRTRTTFELAAKRLSADVLNINVSTSSAVKGETLLDTLRNLCRGLDLALSTLFESFELGERLESRELLDLLATRSPRELALAISMVRQTFDLLDQESLEEAAE